MPVTKYKDDYGIYDVTQCMSNDCKEHYQSKGWVLIRNFFDLDKDLKPVFREVNNLIRLKLEESNFKQYKNDADDRIHSENFIELCKIDRSKAGEIYRATRHLPSLFQLLSKTKNLNFAGFLMETEFVNLLPYIPIRIDIKGEEKYLFGWHQDYPYIQGSPDGVVLWMPLMEMKEGFGGVKIIPESHKNGICDVRLIDPENKNKNGAHTIEIIGSDKFDDYDAYTVEVNLTDVLVFNTLLLHKSVPMSKGDVRWSTQLRYANFQNKTAVEKGWPGGMIEGSQFEDIHPECIKNEN